MRTERGIHLVLVALLLSFTGSSSAQDVEQWSSSRDLHRQEQSRKHLIIRTAVQFGMMALDYELSQRHFQNGGKELMPWFGSRRPSRKRMYAVGVPLNLGAAFLGKKFQVGAALVHGGGIGMTLTF